MTDLETSLRELFETRKPVAGLTESLLKHRQKSVVRTRYCLARSVKEAPISAVIAEVAALDAAIKRGEFKPLVFNDRHIPKEQTNE